VDGQLTSIVDQAACFVCPNKE